MEGTGVEWRGGEGRGGQGRVPDCLGGLSRVGISSRSTRPWNGQPPSIVLLLIQTNKTYCIRFQIPILGSICGHSQCSYILKA